MQMIIQIRVVFGNNYSLGIITPNTLLILFTCCALYTQSPLSISPIIFLSKLHLLAKST